MSSDLRAFVFFLAGVGLLSAGLATVDPALLVVPGVLLIVVALMGGGR